MSVINITAKNFEELVINAPNKVLLDFWAPWCGPCQMVGPVVEEIAPPVSEEAVIEAAESVAEDAKTEE